MPRPSSRRTISTTCPRVATPPTGSTRARTPLSARQHAPLSAASATSSLRLTSRAASPSSRPTRAR
ncbi:hypothetical protein DSO57_1012797 [Entomophthora muscae]|uniref:Uncharacterized protein n=1 Tax=Entomophthora muscae TaxID=34485 RepID=A0ACC2UFI1_9FUNG|nr:hypothetical protein DSO57_1012797 [Entomophthora muscae]